MSNWNEYVLIVAIATDGKNASVAIHDGESDPTALPLAEASGRTWREALGECLSKIDLPAKGDDSEGA